MSFSEGLGEAVPRMQGLQGVGYHLRIKHGTPRSLGEEEDSPLSGPILLLRLSVQAPTWPRGRDEGTSWDRTETPHHCSQPAWPHCSVPATGDGREGLSTSHPKGAGWPVSS